MKTFTHCVGFLLVLVSSLASGQITLVDTYPLGVYPLFLETSGTKLMTENHITGTFTIYNLNHSIFRNITIPILPHHDYHVAYVTETLFDTDSTTVEYMVYGKMDSLNANNYWLYTSIFSDNGTLLFHVDSMNPGGGQVLDRDIRPIYNSDSGTYLMLSPSFGPNIFTNIYSLPGRLPACCSLNNLQSSMIEYSRQKLQFSNSPNPATDKTIIHYSLPDGIRDGKIMIYTMEGSPIKEYSVSREFSTLELNCSDLPSGNYLYDLLLPNGHREVRKMIVIH